MTRVAIGLSGLLAIGYGAFLLVGGGLSDAVNVGVWLAGGVVVHDGFLVPATLVAGLLVARVVPASWRATVAAAGIVLGSVTLVAVPVLGRFGARADNSTLLDRHYLVGWLVLAGLVVSVAVAGRLLAGRVWHARSAAGGRRDGTGPRG